MTAMISAVPERGTRQRLDHIDAMRPIKQAAVISTHALIFMVPAAEIASRNNMLLLTHFSREAFLFVSACMLAYSYRDTDNFGVRTYWKRRFISVGAPYLAWTLIYFLYTSLTPIRGFPYYSFASTKVISVHGLDRLLSLTSSGYYQLYYLLVILEFYVVFPLLVRAMRRWNRWHVVIVITALGWQVVNSLFWADIFSVAVKSHLLAQSSQGFWESRLITSYAFYIVAGVVVALHLNEVHQWIVRHRIAIVIGTLLSGAGILALNQWTASGVIERVLHPGTDPFAIIAIPYTVGAILCVYLLGVHLVDARRSLRTRSIVKSGSDNSYGIYLSQMIWIPLLVRVHRDHFAGVPWPVVTVTAVVIVYGLGFLFSAVVARTPVARVLTGRARVSWRSTTPTRRDVRDLRVDAAEGPLDLGVIH